MDGKTDWAGADVTAALNKYKKLLTYTNADREAIDWPDALQYVNKGQAGYTLMGDWVAAQQLADKMPDTAYTYWPAPGTAGIFQYLADSFTLPTNGAEPRGREVLAEGHRQRRGPEGVQHQEGLDPGPLGRHPGGLPEVPAVAMADWKTDKIVPSCAHGAACTLGQNNDIQSAISQFSGSQDVAELQAALGTAMKPS